MEWKQQQKDITNEKKELRLRSPGTWPMCGWDGRAPNAHLCIIVELSSCCPQMHPCALFSPCSRHASKSSALQPHSKRNCMGIGNDAPGQCAPQRVEGSTPKGVRKVWQLSGIEIGMRPRGIFFLFSCPICAFMVSQLATSGAHTMTYLTRRKQQQIMFS